MEQTRPRGSWRELLGVTWPFVLANSFWMLQISIDRVFLGWSDIPGAVGAAMAAMMLFWTPVALLHATATYATTFVAQYLGAGRPARIGPAVWQSIHFSFLTGIACLLFIPLARPLVQMIGHDPAVQELEITYLRILAISALPLLVNVAAASFFFGRGQTRVVLVVSMVGFAVNAVLDYAWILGRWGFPAMGMAGAGWATVLGNLAAAVLAVGLMLLPRYREKYATLSGWRFDRELFMRMMRFGLPAGLVAFFDILGFTLFTMLVGQLGQVALDATSMAFTLNLFSFLPLMGIGQAVGVLVSRSLGENRPDEAARATWRGMVLALACTAFCAVFFLFLPETLAGLFRGSGTTQPNADAVHQTVVILLRFVVVYCAFDAANLVFSSALRGAGDTRFVSWVVLGLSWPLLVIPTWLACKLGWGLYVAWGFASLYIAVLAFAYLARFCQGKWRTMRVIEPDVIEHPEADQAGPPSLDEEDFPCDTMAEPSTNCAR
jgi:MATE family multidrug resistance protein